MRRSFTTLERRLAKVTGRSVAVPIIPLIDATVFVDDQTFLEFAAADEDSRARMRAGLAWYEEALVAQTMADGPETTDSRAIRAIVVRAALPAEEDLWRLHDDDDDHSPDKQAALERRDALVREAVSEWHREQAAKLPLAERDWDPSGPDDEIIYVEMPSGYPITRAQHRARLEAMGGRPGSTFDPLT